MLRRTPPPATAEEIHAAALQFIRKVSGTRNPPSAFVQAYNGAVGDVAAATERLLAVMGAARWHRGRIPSGMVGDDSDRLAAGPMARTDRR